MRGGPPRSSARRTGRSSFSIGTPFTAFGAIRRPLASAGRAGCSSKLRASSRRRITSTAPPGRVACQIECVERRADSMHAADTTSQAQGGYTAFQYHFFRVANAVRIIHARHTGRANGLYLDGHVAAASRSELDSYGYPVEYGQDPAIGYFP